MHPQFKKLVTLLQELFQLDQPDLDFGLYRVMHAKSTEVSNFLQKDLLPQVQTAFAGYRKADKGELEKALAKIVADLTNAGVDPESSPKVKELRAKIATEAVDVGALEQEVYDHLYGFFRRYYSEGDFLSKRVYKPGVYAIPYAGEEVTLHWANKDQYYIKTNEYLRDYAFRLRPNDPADVKRVHFRLVDVAEGEHGNVKAVEGKERRFVLASENPIVEESGELIIRFTYQPNPAKQKELNDAAEQTILAHSNPALASWINDLGQPHQRSDGTSTSTRLAVHLNRYTARNSFDYFIHKDLGSFLRRELDFYIKNEVMALDDIESDTAPRVEQYLSKIKVVRKIAHKIIDFLAQLEDFQKKLWLKKKFVVETSYCITLDKIPEEYYAEIASNEDQRKAWLDLFDISNTPHYSEPLTVSYLKGNKFLLVDTKFYPVNFKDRIIGHLNDLKTVVDGTLIHSDNFQALQLVGTACQESAKCIYIDPPYNTASSAIPYKNDYKHSSFAAMMQDRLRGLYRLLAKDGAMFVSIDKTERTAVEHLLNEIFGDDNKIEELIWAMNTNNSQAPNYSTNHEYVLVYAKDRHVAEQDQTMFREPKPGYEEVMELISNINKDFPTISYVEQAIQKLYSDHRISLRSEIEGQGLEWEDEKINDPWKGLYNYNRAEYRDEQDRLISETDARNNNAKIFVWREADASMPATKQAQSTRDPNHKNYRFYNPPHPITGKPCPHPKSGWKFAYLDDEDSPDRRSFDGLDRDGRIVWGENENKVPQIKRMLHEVESNVGKSVFSDYSDGEKQTSALFGKSGVFLAPKHADFVSRFILHSAKNDSLIVDCFGGSGSTAHAVIKLNRADKGSRKYVLIETAEYFDAVLKPRILKATYSSDWRSGKPISRDGLSQLIKIIRLESYEDTLNKLQLLSSKAQQETIAGILGGDERAFHEQFMLRYLLNVETRGSQSLLNVQAFNDPTAYTLTVKRPGSDESRAVNVDLIETFHWLLGLTVHHLAAPQTFNARFIRDEQGRLRLDGSLKLAADGQYWFRAITGTMPDGRKTLIIWRKLTGEVEQDNAVLDVWFTKQNYSARDSEWNLIYVNGGNNLENLKTGSDTWKVRLIEEDFQRLMFDTAGG